MILRSILIKWLSEVLSLYVPLFIIKRYIIQASTTSVWINVSASCAYYNSATIKARQAAETTSELDTTRGVRQRVAPLGTMAATITNPTLL